MRRLEGNPVSNNVMQPHSFFSELSKMFKSYHVALTYSSTQCIHIQEKYSPLDAQRSVQGTHEHIETACFIEYCRPYTIPQMETAHHHSQINVSFQIRA